MNNRAGGSLSSDAVLSNIESTAYHILDAYFDNQMPLIHGGASGALNEISKSFQSHFGKMLMRSGGGDCSSGDVVLDPTMNFSPPFGAPEGNSLTLGIDLNDVPIHPYNLQPYPW